VMPKSDWRHCDCCSTHQRKKDFRLCELCGHEVCAGCWNDEYGLEACDNCLHDVIREACLKDSKKVELPKDRCCKNCGWAKWELCKGGKRINVRRHGRCQYPLPKLVLPACMENVSRPRDELKQAIWPKGNCGRGCMCWKGKK